MYQRQSLSFLLCWARRLRCSARYLSFRRPTAVVSDIRQLWLRNSPDRASRRVHSLTPTNTVSPVSEVAGRSGRRYVVERVVQKKGNSPLGVYVASCGGEKYILKDVPDFEYLREIYSKVHSDSQHLRLPQDSVPSRSMYIYRFLTDNFLSLVAKTELPLETTKQILKSALKGLAVLHSQNIVHNDIKANNILIDQKNTEIERVQLGDIEDAAIVPSGSAVVGRQLGNWMWRSPEAHAEGPMNTFSDMFSFGIVCIYAVHKRVIFTVDESELGEDEKILAHVIERHISYFADEDSIQAFLEHIQQSPWAEVFRVIRDGFDKENPRKPFALWEGVDPVLKDLVCRMTAFDPAKRITAQEALVHPWFDGV